MIFNQKYDTAFLDRDGVINKHRPNDYVKNWQEFEFLPDVLDGLKTLSSIFNRIIVVTNQRGVGKGLMSEANLKEIHEKMIEAINCNGGRIDRIYYCVDIDSQSSMRKPQVGMALLAKTDFPEIDFTHSIMIGDSISDIEFGKKMGMRTFQIDHYQTLLNISIQLKNENK